VKFSHLGVLASSILLGVGLVAPTLTIVPMDGKRDWLVDVAIALGYMSDDDFNETTFTIIGVIFDLFSGGDWFLGGILVLFSVIFPVVKLALYWIAINYGSELGKATGLLNWMNRAGKFSMAEVFALALMVVVVKTLPGGSTASLEWGAYVFVASILGAIFVSFALDKSLVSSK
jgi:paraquat-inducible protein A